MLWSTAVGMPLMLLAALVMREQIIPTGPSGWAACIGLGPVHVAGQGGVAWALGKLPATITAVTILVQPVIAVLVSWWAFGETLTPVQALGGAVVLSAIILAQWSTRTTRPADAAQTKTGAGSEEPTPVKL